MTECIKVYSRRHIPWRIRRKIKMKYGGHFDSYENKFVCPYENLNSLSRFCKRHRLICKVENEFSVRSNDYRKTFFTHNKPIFGDFYFCSYCGKPVHSDELTVDHLYPVDRAQKDLRLQKKLQRKGLKNINDEKNLVPACCKCNSKKRAKMGFWIVKGEVGRYQGLWIIRHLIRIVFLIIVLIYVYPYLMHILRF